MNYDYNNLLEKIEKFYQKKPDFVIRELQKVVYHLEDSESDKFSLIMRELPWDFILFIISFMAIALLGFFSYSVADNFPLYLFGFVFFAAGVSIGCFLKGFGIIFLFSHGVTGMCIMEASLLGDLLNSPILTDAPKWFPVSAGIVIFMFIVAILSLIVHNLSDTVKKMKYFKLIPLVCFFIAFLLTIIIRRILL